jgi:thiol-disulfide isomerase/thioredoxin
MREFDEVYAEVGEDINFMMVDLADGQRETIEAGTQYIEEQGFSFPVYFDTEQEAAYAYGIMSIPTTLFIDKDGYIVTGAVGAIDAETLRKWIDSVK